MKANELMIGDWVYNNPSYFNDDYNGVTEFPDELQPYKIERGEDLEETGCYSPIPLTAEILEKNGWKWNRYNTFLELVAGTIHLSWGFYPNCISASDWAENGDCQITSLRCMFVHKLQHALRMCGLNELADNFKV